MTRALTVRRRAKAQIRRAAKWYDDQRDGLGQELLDEVRRSLDLIQGRPEMFPSVHGPARRVLLSRFPYAAYYLIHDEAVVVIAFLHGRQDRDAEFAGLV